MATSGRTKKKSDDSSAYLRAPKPLKAARGLKLSRESRQRALLAGATGLVAALAWWFVHDVVLQAEPFRIDTELGAVRIDGVAVITEEEVASVFAEDLGSSLVLVDTAARLEQLQSIPWVRHARVVRVWPNSVAVAIDERDPVAFLRMEDTNAVRMIDTDGTILDVRRAAARVLPVLTGITTDMPLSERRKRVGLFEEVMDAFREQGAEVVGAVSEVDVADLANAVVLAKHRDRMIKLQMGDRHLKHRLDVFLSYIEAWRSEYGPVQAVDLRFEKQVTVKPVDVKEGSA